MTSVPKPATRSRSCLIAFAVAISLCALGRLAGADTYPSDTGTSRTHNLTVTAATHKFVVNGIFAYRETKWYVNGAYKETDVSDFWNGYWDPEYSYTFSTGTTVLKAYVRNSSGTLLETHTWNCTVARPDLTKSSDNITKTSCFPGDTLSVSVTVKNIGQVSANSGYVYYYWKKGSVTYSDTYKVGSDSYGSLAVNGTSSESFNYPVSSSASLGTYYFYYFIDATNTSIESNGNNNKFQWTITVKDDPPSNPSSFVSTPSTNAWTTDNTISVSWSGASDDRALKRYYYRWTTSASSSVTTSDSYRSTTSGSGSRTSPSLSDGSSWYFHIRYMDSADHLATSTAHYGPFKIDRTDPGKPSHESPSNGDTVATLRPTVRWRAASDGFGSGVVKYRLKVFQNWGVWWDKVDKDVTGSSYTLSASEALEWGKNYGWKLYAIDAVGNESGWTGEWYFTVRPSQVTISGHMQYRDEWGTPRDAAHVEVEVWEKDALGDDLIAQGYTGATGRFTFTHDTGGQPIMNVDEGLGESGTRDIYVKIFSRNEACRVSNVWTGFLGTTYSGETDPDYDVPGPVYDVSVTWSSPGDTTSAALGIPAQVREAREWLIANGNGWAPGSIGVWYPAGSWPTHYGVWLLYEAIHIPQGSADDTDAIYHEYAHAIHFNARGKSMPSGAKPTGPEEDPDHGTPDAGTGGHWISSESSPGFAISEGWAEAFQSFVSNDARSTTVNLENNRLWMGRDGWMDGTNDGADPHDPNTGEIVEGAVASILWDIVDPADDDRIDSEFGKLWTILLNDDPDDILEFRTMWMNRGYGMQAELDAIYIDHGIPVADDEFDDGAGNDTKSSCTVLGSLTAPESWSNRICTDPDWYQFTTLGRGGLGHNVTISFANRSGDGCLDLYLFRASDDALLDWSTAGSAETQTVELDNLPPGDYKIAVTGHGDDIDTVGYEGDMNPTYTLTIAPPPQDTDPPTAELTSAPPITTDETYYFNVTYRDNVAVDRSDIDDSDVLVTGPNGYSEVATLFTVSPSGTDDRSPLTGIYTIPAPGGSWDFGDNGTYTVSMRANEVTDTSENPVPAGALDTFQVSMPDTEAPTAQFALAASQGNEGETVNVDVTLSKPWGDEVRVPFDLSGSATPGDDYIVNPQGEVVFAVGDTLRTIEVTLKTDQDVEGDEHAILTLHAAPNATVGVPGAHDLTIKDPDLPTVQFAVASSQGSEGETVNVAVTLSKAWTWEIWVRALLSGDAKLHDDYEVDPEPHQDVVFAAGQVQAEIEVTLKTDDAVEGDETLTLTLVWPMSADLGTPSVHDLTIKDVVIPPTVQFAQAASSGREGETANVAVTLSKPWGQVVSVPFSVGGDATEGDDYTVVDPQDKVVVFPAQQTSQTVVVRLETDDLVEGDEQLLLTLQQPANADLGTAKTHDLTIIDVPAGNILSTQKHVEAAPESNVQIPVVLDLEPGVQVTTLSFNCTILPGIGDPPAADPVTFSPAPGIPAPQMNDSIVLPGSVLVGWLSHMASPLTGTVTIGTVSFDVEPGAELGDTYISRIVNPSGTDGGTPVPIQPGPARTVYIAGEPEVTLTSCTAAPNPVPSGEEVTLSGTGGQVKAAAPQDTQKIVIGLRDSDGNYVGGDPVVVWSGQPGTTLAPWAGSGDAVIRAPLSAGTCYVWVCTVKTTDDTAAVQEFRDNQPLAEDEVNKKWGAPLEVSEWYLVGDVYPHTGQTDDAGDFGDGNIENADVVPIFYWSLGAPVDLPVQGSDRWDAADTYHEDTPPQAGGDGKIENADVVKVFYDSLIPGRTRYERARSGDGRVSRVWQQAGAAQAGGELRPLSAGDTLAAGDVSGPQGGEVEVPLTLNLASGDVISTLQFNCTVAPVGGAPQVGTVTYVPAPGIATPSMNDNTTLPGSALVGWFTHMIPPLSGQVPLGVVRVTIPAGANLTDQWDVQILSPSATDGGTPVTVSGVAGRVSVAPTQVTLESSPPGLDVTIDATTGPAPQTATGNPGEPLAMPAPPSPQPGAAGTPYVFSHFEDPSGATVVPPTQMPASSITYTAVFVPDSQWEPYVPIADDTGIVVTTGAPTTAHVTLTFYNAGFRVTDWGQVTRIGNEFSADAQVERWTGFSPQVIIDLGHTYSLGELPPGDYVFTFKASGEEVKSQRFGILPAPPVADAGDDQAVYVGDTVTLDGSGSRAGSETNVALAANGGTVTGVYAANLPALIDGDSTNYTGGSGFAYTSWRPRQGYMTVKLDQVYQLSRIRVKLWDGDNRFYRYYVDVATSSGGPWQRVVTRTSGQHRGSCEDAIGSVAAQYVRITGTYNSANNNFHVVELEAYASAPLTYAWTQISAPQDSQATLDDPTAVRPTFVPDLVGDYVFELRVKDDVQWSDPDQATVTATLPPPPMAVPGPDLIVEVGERVQLSGSASWSGSEKNVALAANGGTITGTNGRYWDAAIDGKVSGYTGGTGYGYTYWTTRPPGSMTITLAATYPIGRIRVKLWDLDGRSYRYYVEAATSPAGPWQTVVDRTGGAHQSWCEDSFATPVDAKYLRITGTHNSANAGFHVVEFEAYESKLDYQWTLVSAPPGSQPSLETPTSVEATFVADVEGDYQVELRVYDGVQWSAPQPVWITAIMPPRPLADAGPYQTAEVGATVTLDGSGSRSLRKSDNVALASNGATVTGTRGARWAELIDGNSTQYDGGQGYAYTYWPGPWPGTMTVTLLQTYDLTRLRVKLWDGDSRFYRYHVQVATSLGGPWASVVDRTAGEHRGWCEDTFGPAQARYIRITGTYNTANAGFHVVELEAYAGQPLEYQWEQVSGPPVTLSDPSAVRPTFTPSVAGDYQFRLVVNDGVQDSLPDTVWVSVGMPPRPVADAGPNQNAFVGDTVTLDGSGSRAGAETNVALASNGAAITGTNGAGRGALIDGNSTGYTGWAGFGYTYWRRRTPGSMTITLAGTSAIGRVRVKLWDLDGRYYRYYVEVATNLGGPWDRVVDRTTGQNRGWCEDTFAPVQARYIRITGTYNTANAGFHVVELEAYADRPLTYAWTLESAPQGSQATLDDTSAVRPMFLPDVAGNYEFELVVNDGIRDSLPDRVWVAATEAVAAPPPAPAGAGVPGAPGGDAGKTPSDTDTRGEQGIELLVMPESGPAPLEVQAFVLGAKPGAACKWDFGDGTSGSGDEVTHTYWSPGTYTITVKVDRQVARATVVVEEPRGD